MRVWFGLAAAVFLGGCSVAQIRVPDPLIGAGSVTRFHGIGGKPSGTFEAGAYSGRFERRLERASFEDGSIARTGGSRFTIAGPEISSTIEVECAMGERALDLGLAELTVQPMAYRCDLTAEGRAIPARFELQEVVGCCTAAHRYEREGEIALGGETIRFRSLHHYVGTSLPSLTPVGYEFRRRGETVGALALTGQPALTATKADPGAMRTMMVAAIALATFWDPAVHDLD